MDPADPALMKLRDLLAQYGAGYKPDLGTDSDWSPTTADVNARMPQGGFVEWLRSVAAGIPENTNLPAPKFFMDPRAMSAAAMGKSAINTTANWLDGSRGAGQQAPPGEGYSFAASGLGPSDTIAPLGLAPMGMALTPKGAIGSAGGRLNAINERVLRGIEREEKAFDPHPWDKAATPKEQLYQLTPEDPPISRGATPNDVREAGRVAQDDMRIGGKFVDMSNPAHGAAVELSLRGGDRAGAIEAFLTTAERQQKIGQNPADWRAHLEAARVLLSNKEPKVDGSLTVNSGAMIDPVRTAQFWNALHDFEALQPSARTKTPAKSEPPNKYGYLPAKEAPDNRWDDPVRAETYLRGLQKFETAKKSRTTRLLSDQSKASLPGTVVNSVDAAGPRDTAAAAALPERAFGKKPIKAASEDIYEVLESQFPHGRVVGNQMMPIDRLKGGVSADPAETKRVADLVAAMSGPEGYRRRLIVDSEGNVIEGQHRLEALRQLGEKNVPVHVIEDMTLGLDMDKLNAAVAALGLPKQQARQLLQNSLESAREAGSGAKAFETDQFPRGWEDKYSAVLRAIDSSTRQQAKAPGAEPSITAILARILSHQ